MSATIKNCSVKVFCETHHREIEVYIRCIVSNGEVLIAECNGCDFGYDGSQACKDCTEKCTKDFISNYSKS